MKPSFAFVAAIPSALAFPQEGAPDSDAFITGEVEASPTTANIIRETTTSAAPTVFVTVFRSHNQDMNRISPSRSDSPATGEQVADLIQGSSSIPSSMSLETESPIQNSSGSAMSEFRRPGSNFTSHNMNIWSANHTTPLAPMPEAPYTPSITAELREQPANAGAKLASVQKYIAYAVIGTVACNYLFGLA